MEDFNKDRSLFFRLFWIPIGIMILCRIMLTILLGPGPQWGEGLLGLVGCSSCVISAIFLFWGALLIIVEMRSGRPVRSLILATFVSGLPALLFLILMFFTA